MSDPYAILKTQTNKGQKMTNEQLAQRIIERYTPLAFACACKGTDPKCAEAMMDTFAYAQNDTVRRIALYISNLPEND
jgi:hypothetical protein